MVQDFTKLVVWQRAHALALAVIDALPPAACRAAPGLRAQAIRAALSIAQNIAEGCGKRSPLELARFADIACGSALELRCELIQARDIHAISTEKHAQFELEIEELRKMLLALANSVRRKHDSRPHSETLST